MSGSSHDIEFKTVVMNFLYRLSDATEKAQPFDNLTDWMWATLYPSLSEYDIERWRQTCTPITGSKQELYQISINKVQLISLVLYRSGVFPNRDNLRNRKYAQVMVEEGKVQRGGLKTHLLSDIQLKNFLMRHMILASYIAKNMSSYGVHYDIFWAILSPYVTHEDYVLWQENNNKNQGKNDYVWNIEKVKICMDVLDRADFLWQTGVTDEPEEEATEDYNIEFRGS
jgi:hypothetical protein